jgi:hypothetical protein
MWSGPPTTYQLINDVQEVVGLWICRKKCYKKIKEMIDVSWSYLRLRRLVLFRLLHAKTKSPPENIVVVIT